MGMSEGEGKTKVKLPPDKGTVKRKGKEENYATSS